MKNFNETIKEAIIENDLVENFEIINDCEIKNTDMNHISFHVYDENTASDVAENADGSFSNWDGTECINFEFENETYYFVKQ
jgi:hypothetical protein